MSQVSQESYSHLLTAVKQVVGEANVYTDPNRTKRYRTGFFYGLGDALCVVRPATLVEYYKVAKLCAEADVVVINQAQNTGVTGGSTPWGNDYDRPVVIINTLKIDGIELVNTDGDLQAVCFAGSTLFSLEEKLAKYNREPHSVIGSSCIGASVVGGICNNSGGTLVQRGPAFTELACYARVNEQGEWEFVNNLGIDLGDGTPEEQLARLEAGNYENVSQPEGKLASSRDYAAKVVQVDEPSPSRFNADPTRLKEASGSAGHLVVFAVRVDTFKKAAKAQVFYIGTNNPDELTDIRRAVLTKFPGLPVSGEYIHGGTFDDAVKYGKDTFFVIDKFGTKHLPKFYALKDFYERNFGRRKWLPSADRMLQFVADFLPNQLPARILNFRDRFEHHLILQTADDLIGPTEEFLKEYFAEHTGDFFACTPVEAKKAMLLRFSVGSTLARTMKLFANDTAGMVALDVAFRRNDREWYKPLCPELKDAFVATNSCGHFLCHVFHLDFLVKKGYDLEEVKQKLLADLDARGAQYPAEHNVGHLYQAKPELAAHYKNLDPTNSFNPGVGKQTKAKWWGEAPEWAAELEAKKAEQRAQALAEAEAKAQAEAEAKEQAERQAAASALGAQQTVKQAQAEQARQDLESQLNPEQTQGLSAQELEELAAQRAEKESQAELARQARQAALLAEQAEQEQLAEANLTLSEELSPEELEALTAEKTKLEAQAAQVAQSAVVLGADTSEVVDVARAEGDLSFSELAQVAQEQAVEEVTSLQEADVFSGLASVHLAAAQAVESVVTGAPLEASSTQEAAELFSQAVEEAQAGQEPQATEPAAEPVVEAPEAAAEAAAEAADQSEEAAQEQPAHQHDANCACGHDHLLDAVAQFEEKK